MKKSILLVLVMVFVASFNFAQTPTSLPIDFEGGAASVEFLDFDGGQSQIIANPDATGLNTSSFVVEHVRNQNQTWAGTFLLLDAPLDFTTNTVFTMKVWSPAADIPVLFKIENVDNAAVNVERTVNTTVSGEWEELTFDFGMQDNDTYTKIVLIFNNGVMGDGTVNSTYYFDDIVFTTGSGPVLDQIDLPLTFDSENVDYTLTDFGGNSSLLGEDPTDATNTVAITTKTAGAETWAGTTIGTNMGFATVIPFTLDETVMYVNVYSPAVGTPIRLKVEDHNDATHTCETETLTTTSNEWETIAFDFSNEATGTAALNLDYSFDKASIFFDFGTNGNDAVYYWENVSFGPMPVSVNSLIDNNISLYPNPAKDIFVIKGIDNVKEINVYSINGQKVEVSKISNNSYNVSNLATGIYTVSITDAQGNVSYSKLIKN